MRIGIPTEVKNHEYRVAATPEGVRGDPRGARGDRSDRRRPRVRDPRRAVRRGRGRSPPDADAVFGAADLIVKVKEPQPEEYPGSARARCCSPTSTSRPTRGSPGSWRNAGCALGLRPAAPDGRLPLLAPMSEIAGRMAPQEGAKYLERPQGGRGVLMGGACGVAPARVVVLGGGWRAPKRPGVTPACRPRSPWSTRTSIGCAASTGCGAAALQTVMCSGLAIEELVLRGRSGRRPHVLVPAAKTAVLVSSGAGAHDGIRARCSSTSRSTRAGSGKAEHLQRDARRTRRSCRRRGRGACCIGNMPAAVPHTSTYALTNVDAALYVLAIAGASIQEAVQTGSVAGAWREHVGQRGDERGRGRARRAPRRRRCASVVGS